MFFFFLYRLLLRVCHTLRSRAREVRGAARDTLAKITVSLGNRYLMFVLKELRSSLTRGYQVNSNYSKLSPCAASLLYKRKYKNECLNDSDDRDNVKKATGLMSKTKPDSTRAFFCRHCATLSEENLSSIDYACLALLGPVLFIDAVLSSEMLLFSYAPS